MKVRIVIFVICIQALLITLLSITTFEKFKERTLGVSVNPLNKSSLTVSQDGELKHFYEPKADITEEVDLSWLGEEYKYKVYYDINSDTLNQHKLVEVEKPAETFRIVTLGDSFTFGVNVNTQDNYPSVLESILNTECSSVNFQVLNLGVSGYDFHYAAHRLKERGLKYNPDLVVWLLIGDNFQRVDEMLIPLSAKYALEMKRTGEYEKEVKEGNLYPAWVKARDEIIANLGSEEEILKLQKERLGSIFQFFKNRVVFSLFENYPQKYNDIVKQIVLAQPNASLALLSDIYDKKLVLPDSHPSKKGYAQIAKDTFQYLRKERLIPCQ